MDYNRFTLKLQNAIQDAAMAAAGKQHPEIVPADIIIALAEQKDGSFVSSGLRDSDKLLKDFWNTINDSNKVSVNLLTENSITIYTEGNGDKIIAIEVPRAERALRPVYINNNPYTGTFRRNFEGDYHCTKREVNAMIRDAVEEAFDGKFNSWQIGLAYYF